MPRSLETDNDKCTTLYAILGIMLPSALLVSAGLLAPKKSDHKFARKHNYLNYGLLSLGTLLHEAGRPVRIIHGGFSAPEALAERLANEYPGSSCQPLLLSLPSYLAVPWAQSFLRCLRRAWPNVPVVVGGRWVVGDGGAWIRSRLPETDLVVYGTAEERVLALLNPGRWVNLPGTDRSALPGPSDVWTDYRDLNYELTDSFRDFTPSIEVSRGCGRGCLFCEEKSAPLTKMREPASVVQAMQKAVELYDDPGLHFYLEASWFVPSRSWALEFVGEYVRSGLKTVWRCETRVDSLPADVIAELSRGGLRILDLGLESASAYQLVCMNKTSNPDRYLRRASDLLQCCQDFGVWPKVNVMLYAGETLRTIEETRGWLDQYSRLIKGVSVGSVTVYGHGVNARRHMTDLCALGASPVDADALERDGYSNLNLSREVNYLEARRLAMEIAQSHMSDRDYYDLKSFSYFPRGYAYNDFRTDLVGVQQDEVPFRLA